MEYLRNLQAEDDARAEALRAAAGVLIGLAAAAIAIRKTSGPGEPWGDMALLIVFAIPALVLFGGGLAAAQTAELPRPWHAVWLVSGIVLLYLTTQQMIAVVDGDSGAPLNIAWTFAVVAVASLIAAREAFVRFGYLAAGIAGAISFLALCDELLPDGIAQEAATFRNVCVVSAVALFAAAFAAFRSGQADEDEAAELITAGGIFFVLGTGIVTLAILYVGAAASVVPGAAGLVESGALPEPSTFWDVALGVGSLALVVGGAFVEKRGPAYVGAAGLAIFITTVATDLDNPDRDGSLVGWPLVITLAAIAGLVGSAVGSQRDTAPEPTPPPDPGGTPWST